MEGRKMVVETDLSRMYISDVELEAVEVEGIDLADGPAKAKKPLKSQFQARGGGKP